MYPRQRPVRLCPIFSSQALPVKVKSVFLIVLTVVGAGCRDFPGSHVEVGLRSVLGELGVSALLGCPSPC